mmetsp:Transcript_39985/g.76481  ORF Transcript_39985/g.76481 Transcript_39985/m.76481 type:complete len:121 (-) Transcript_39985:281-643(-)
MLPITNAMRLPIVSAVRVVCQPRGVKKTNLPQKDCAVCGRPFSWRKKWERNWEDIRYCSERCRRDRGRADNASKHSPPTKSHGLDSYPTATCSGFEIPNLGTDIPANRIEGLAAAEPRES